MAANLITITGNMGRPAQLKFTGSGRAVWGFSLAFTPRRKDGEQWVDAGPTIWFDVTAWGDLAETLADTYGERQGQATVTGRLGSREWTNNEGKTVEQITINADAVTIVPKGQRSQPRQPQADAWSTPAQPGYDAEPPF